MKADFSRDVDVTSQQLLELYREVDRPERRLGPSAAVKVDKDVDITLRCRLTPSYGPEHANLVGTVPSSDFLDTTLMRPEDLFDSETSAAGWDPDLRHLPVGRLAARADSDHSQTRSPSVPAPVAM
jgi:hypothetical protein